VKSEAMNEGSLRRLVRRLLVVRDARADAYNTKTAPRLQSEDDELWRRFCAANARCGVAFRALWKCLDDKANNVITKLDH
jgi:hypothetical protein